MPKSVRKTTLSRSRNIPFNRLALSQSNVCRVKAGVSIEELAQDIPRRTPLQSLTVRPVLAEDGGETGMFEVGILQAVCEARGEQAAQHIDHLKKGVMAQRAQELLAGFGWPPEPLRTPGRAIAAVSATCDVELGSPVESSGESATTGYETAMTDFERSAEDHRSRQSRPLSRPSS